MVVTEQAVALNRPGCGAHTSISQLPNYQKSWLRQGFAESDLAIGGSDRLAERLVAMGDAGAIAMRVKQHLDAGADHVLIQVLGNAPTTDPLSALRELAPALGLNPS